MTPQNDWLTFSLFCQQKEWPRLLGVMDDFLNSDAVSPFMTMRIIEFNYLYGSNVRLFIQAAAGQAHRLKPPHLQVFIPDNLPVQIVPGIHGKIPAGNNTLLAIRKLLSDVMIEAFRTQPVNDETLLTMALYLHPALLKNNKAANTILSSMAGTTSVINEQEEEYSTSRDFLLKIKNHPEGDAAGSLPSWLQVWTAGYKTILETLPEHQLLSIYRSTLYFIIIQFGIITPLIARLEYYIKKLTLDEIINA